MKTRIYLLLVLAFVFLLSCAQKEDKKKTVYGEEIVLERYEDSTKMIVIRYNTEDTTFAFKSYFYKNGQRYMEGELHNEKRNGEWMAWDELGHLLTIGHYEDGLSQGLKTVYFTNGVKRYEGEMLQNDRVGVWRFWNQKDSLIKEIDYGVAQGLQE